MRVRPQLPGVLFRAALLLAAPAAAQTPVRGDAVAALQRGDFPAAERILRAAAAAHPDDAMTLSLLGAALDSLQRLPEAGEVHQRAVAKAPRSADVLNNYAAHLWLAGDREGSRRVYLRIVALDPAQFNANLQLARQAILSDGGEEALRWLDKIPARQADTPSVWLARLQALHAGGSHAGTSRMAAEERLAELSRGDDALAVATGRLLSSFQEYSKAEAFFEIALRARPAGFDILYDLAVAANLAGHYERAKEVFETALLQQPQNVDVLYGLARAEEALKHWEAALLWLARAARLAPGRADIQKTIALTATELNALDDAATAWDRYIALAPDDDVARRERGYIAARTGKTEEAVRELEGYLGRHPGDVAGHYELGQALRATDPEKALLQYDKALSLDPRFVAALSARGSLRYQEGKPEAARQDLEDAARLSPDDAFVLDRLGQTYQALDRTADAVRLLRRAAALAPADSRILFHFSRALAEAGGTEESKEVMERFRQLGPEKRSGLPPGLVDYLGLPAEQRQASYRARLEKATREHPEDAAVRVEYLKLLLPDRRPEEIAAAVLDLEALKPPGGLLREAGRALLSTGQYVPATELLRRAGPGAEIDLALATFRGGDRPGGLRLLEAARQAAPAADYLRARAEMLTATGKTEEAREALRDLARMLPGDRGVLLMNALAAELNGKPAETDRLLDDIRNRWPEWYPVWTARAAAMKSRGQTGASAQALETAAALGAPSGAPPDPAQLLQAMELQPW